jgi:hypothetical protein
VEELGLTGSSQARVEAAQAKALETELTEQEKRANVVRLGIHSRPISKDDPDIAPALVPLRERLMAMVRRPVNIQATRDFVMYVRGELLGQPYLVLIEKPNEAEQA